VALMAAQGELPAPLANLLSSENVRD